jgi:hypothetical protein
MDLQIQEGVDLESFLCSLSVMKLVFTRKEVKDIGDTNLVDLINTIMKDDLKKV